MRIYSDLPAMAVSRPPVDCPELPINQELGALGVPFAKATLRAERERHRHRARRIFLQIPVIRRWFT